MDGRLGSANWPEGGETRGTESGERTWEEGPPRGRGGGDVQHKGGYVCCAPKILESEEKQGETGHLKQTRSARKNPHRGERVGKNGHRKR